MLTTHTATLEEIKSNSVESLLEEVLAEEEILTVKMPDGAEVVIRPRLRLEPLPVLEGSVPRGWRDAIYNETG
jgi:hypothetical protein